jgi:hypothetical protein
MIRGSLRESAASWLYCTAAPPLLLLLLMLLLLPLLLLLLAMLLNLSPVAQQPHHVAVYG